MTPYAVLEPVFLAGSTISMATLHNAEDVARKDLREGDRVLIEKGGDVIPKVVKPILAAGADAQRALADADRVPGVRQRAAPRRGRGRLAVRQPVVPGAPAAQPRALRVTLGDEHRGSRGVADRSAARAGPGARLRRHLRLEAGQLEHLVVTPREPRSETARPRKLGKVGRNVIEQIERSKANDLSRLIYALGIRHVGEKAAATLARHFRTMDRVLDAPVEALQTVSEIGPVVAASVRLFADEPRNRAVVERLAAAGVNMASQAPEPGDEPGPLAGKVFVLTGTLASMTREEATAALERLGRKSVGLGQPRRPTTSSPGPTPAASSRKRRQLGVETLDEEAFRKLIMS